MIPGRVVCGQLAKRRVRVSCFFVWAELLVKHHLNPNDPADANLDRDQDGYTNIEEYLNDVQAMGSFQGARYGRLTHLASSGSPVISRFLGSQMTFLPVRTAMLPRWQTVAEWCPISTLEMGSLRLLMQSSQFWW